MIMQGVRLNLLLRLLLIYQGIFWYNNKNTYITFQISKVYKCSVHFLFT